MIGFNNYVLNEIQKMINGYKVPNDVQSLFLEKSFYSKKLANNLLFNFGVENTFLFFNEYNKNALLYEEVCFKIAEIGTYDLVYIFKNDTYNLYLANSQKGYCKYEMILVEYSLLELFNDPEIINEYLGDQSKTYFSTRDFELCENFVNHSKIPFEFYTIFGKKSRFDFIVNDSNFYLGAESFDDLFYLSNDLNTTLTGSALIIAKDDGEINLLYLFDKSGSFKGLYGIHDDNVGDDEGLIYICDSLSDFFQGIGYENYLKI